MQHTTVSERVRPSGCAVQKKLIMETGQALRLCKTRARTIANKCEEIIRFDDVSWDRIQIVTAQACRVHF